MFDKVKEQIDLVKKANQLKKDLESVTIEVNEARGIKMVMNAAQQVRSIEIDEALLIPANKNRIQMDLLKSFNNGMKKCHQAQAAKVKSSGD